MAQTYARPDLPPGVPVQKLVAEGTTGQELTPKTRVLIVNRGAQPYCDKFDGRDYVVPGGAVSEVEYEVANHFRERSVIPGSRDPVTGKQEHFIAILGIDSEERCKLLDGVEQEKADTSPEALDRSLMDGADRDVHVVATQAARARSVGRGSKRVVQEVTDEDALAPPEGGDAMRTIAEDAANDERRR